MSLWHMIEDGDLDAIAKTLSESPDQVHAQDQVGAWGRWGLWRPLLLLNALILCYTLLNLAIFLTVMDFIG